MKKKFIVPVEFEIEADDAADAEFILDRFFWSWSLDCYKRTGKVNLYTTYTMEKAILKEDLEK